MPTIELTDDEFHWACVAIENAKESAERWQKSDPEDVDTQLDSGLLINRYNELQHKFPPPDIVISLEDLGPER